MTYLYSNFTKMNIILISTLLMITLTNAIPHDLLTMPSLPSHLILHEPPIGKPLSKQAAILEGGKKLSEAITAKIVGPIVIFNSKVAAAAGALPPLLAAKGAVIGSAIATPIEVGAVAGSSIASGVTGKLVAVPISMAAGAAAKFVGAVETGKEIWNEKVVNGAQLLKNGAIKLGHMMLKPVAVIVGANTALAGAGLGVAGAGIKGVGVGMEVAGGKMAATGLKAKGIGALMIGWALEPLIKPKLAGAALIGSKLLGHDGLNDLEARGVGALMHGLLAEDGIGSKGIGSHIQLPMLEQLLSDDAKAHLPTLEQLLSHDAKAHLPILGLLSHDAKAPLPMMELSPDAEAPLPMSEPLQSQDEAH